MEVRINKTHGLTNNLLIKIPIEEIEDALLCVPFWKELNRGEGMVRWRGQEEFKKTEHVLKKFKASMEQQLMDLGLLDGQWIPKYRIIAIGNRNLGNNRAVVAFDIKKNPHLFYLKDEPVDQHSYSCIVKNRSKTFSIQNLCFEENRIFSSDKSTDLTQKIEWCTSGQQILREGKITNIEDIIHEFGDIRHVFALDPFRDDSKKILEEIYGNHPEKFNLNLFRESALEKLKLGIPRSRYLHNCIGLSEENVFIIQREGTPEEIAQYFLEVGAHNAIILDNGGSVGCWTWWAYRSQDSKKAAGGFIFAAPDYRPPATSIIAFKFRGPAQTNLFPASASVTVI
ncbi:hypothetical protein C5S35_18195 [Candidatus Methanophagaceae archaeon]|nr:hypothetical protein C5S35_18195 [Methanophagales archaeon]